MIKKVRVYFEEEGKLNSTPLRKGKPLTVEDAISAIKLNSMYLNITAIRMYPVED